MLFHFYSLLPLDKCLSESSIGFYVTTNLTAQIESGAMTELGPLLSWSDHQYSQGTSHPRTEVSLGKCSIFFKALGTLIWGRKRTSAPQKCATSLTNQALKPFCIIFIFIGCVIVETPAPATIGSVPAQILPKCYSDICWHTVGWQIMGQ